MLGLVIYDGPSLLDDSPIVTIAVLRSKNAKTGDMIQTYILRSDMPPLEAIRTAADDAICGDCPHRGTSCYVDVGRSVSAVFWAWVRGVYPLMAPHKAARWARKRRVRIGTYGDGAATPLWVWQDFLSEADGHTAYTHQWRKPQFSDLKQYFMASADTEQDAHDARALGWRSFRVRAAGTPLLSHEFSCPASDEAGHARQCITCMACHGGRVQAASVSIEVHGRGKKHFAISVA
jgi:hypothetical protein